MDNRIGNAGGIPPHASSDEKSHKERRDAPNKTQGDALQERFNAAGEQRPIQNLIDEPINPKDVISELRSSLLSLEEIINKQESSLSSSNQSQPRFTKADQTANGEQLKELSGLLMDITQSTPDQQKMREIQARLDSLSGEVTASHSNANPTSWTHSGRTFSTVRESSVQTDVDQSYESIGELDNGNSQQSYTSTERPSHTGNELTSEKALPDGSSETLVSSEPATQPQSIGIVAGGVLLSGLVALGIITGGTVTLLDGGRDVYLGTRDGEIDKAAIGASKLAAGASILIGITTANPASLAGGAIIYAGSLLYQHREVLTSQIKQLWNWFKSD